MDEMTPWPAASPGGGRADVPVRGEDAGEAFWSGDSWARFTQQWRRRWWVPLATSALALLLAVTVLRLWPAQYTATLLVAPTARAGLAAMGARAPVGGTPEGPAAGTRPVEFGRADEGLSDFARFLHLAVSTPVAADLLAETALATALFPGRWDAQNGVWTHPTDVAGRFRRFVLALVGREDWRVPDSVILGRHLRRAVTVDAIGGGPVHRLTFRHPDRATALLVLDRLTRTADAHLRREAARRAEATIAHIDALLRAKQDEYQRNALTNLRIEVALSRAMLDADLPFAADLLEPPSAPAQPDWPDPLMVLALAPGLGGVAGVFIVAVLAGFRGPAAPPQDPAGAGGPRTPMARPNSGGPKEGRISLFAWENATG